jgi:predicted transcriptional regulator
MKNASIPSLRVAPELRQAVESVLDEGETLSSFMEQSLRLNIARRRVRTEFVARGLASREEARRTGEYIPAEDVLLELDDMLAQAAATGRPEA